MHLGRISCLFNRHRAGRRSVQWTGLRYEGNCRSCGKPVGRTITGGWRAVSAMTEPDSIADLG
jgi:hypothetical protein